MTDVSAQARADLERLDETIRRAQETIARASKERDDIMTFLRVHERHTKGSRPADSSPNSLAALVSSQSKSEAVRVAVRNIIEAEGRRLPINEIFDRLTAARVEIGGEQPKANLANILSRAKQLFEYRNPDGWWLVGVPEESASADLLAQNGEGPDGLPPSGPSIEGSDYSLPNT